MSIVLSQWGNVPYIMVERSIGAKRVELLEAQIWESGPVLTITSTGNLGYLVTTYTKLRFPWPCIGDKNLSVLQRCWRLNEIMYSKSFTKFPAQRSVGQADSSVGQFEEKEVSGYRKRMRSWTGSWPMVEMLWSWTRTKKRGQGKIWGRALMCGVGPLILVPQEAKAHGGIAMP